MPDEENSPFEIDRTVHEPARLAILTILSACARADFTFLQRATGLSKGNLSVQLTRLEDEGLVSIEKVIQQKKSLTTAEISEHGRQELSRYWATMQEIQQRGVVGRLNSTA